jgi:hypothetical protein
VSVGQDVRERASILSIKFLSSIDIVDVTDDASCGVAGDCVDKALVKTNFFKDAQVFSLFALIVRQLHMAALKEKLQLFRIELEIR